VNRFLPLLGSFVLALSAAACRDEPAPAPADPAQAEAAAKEATAKEAARQAREAAQRSLNPQGLPAYSGPTGTVSGVVKISGDEPPLVPEMVSKLAQLPPGSCPRALELHRKLYRQGVDRTLADVLVTVTEYQGFLPARGDTVRVEAKGCAFDARILAMTFGQHLDVYNLDNQAYIPRLVGTTTYALRVALPGGPPVPVFAPKPGQYMLVDQTREYMRSDLFVLNYPTFDVTGLDGKFSITGIPVGKVKVTAFSPALGKVVEQSVEVEAGADKPLSFESAISESEFRDRMRAAEKPTPDTAAAGGAPARQ
jgi:hypothetical protein